MRTTRRATFGLLAAMGMAMPAAAQQQPPQPQEGVHTIPRFAFENGREMENMRVGYATWGRLNERRDNAIVLVPGTSSGRHWAASYIGPGKAFDPERYFIIGVDPIGGGNSSKPADGMGPDFPRYTIRDMVRAQQKLVESLGIARLLAVIGGSMGGMQVLEWAATFPEAVFAAAPIATAPHHSAQNIAFHEVGRAAIHADPDWNKGRYSETGRIPAQGLGVARMVAHITYMSEDSLTRKFGRKLQGASALTLLEDVFQVESYLRHQGSTFVRRFDANSYLTITRAMDLFDLANEHGSLPAAFRSTPTRFFVASFSSDWLFPTRESRALVRALNAAAARTSFVEITTDKGHDAFLLEEPEFHRALGGFLAGAAQALGV